ncbi:hypothetical protein Sarmat_00263 [Rickettsiales endosymbiont of Paramecium tredecaurelia]|nr:hypothetical protein [Candidatus Sarmatiella mevalonica]
MQQDNLYPLLPRLAHPSDAFMVDVWQFDTISKS